MKLRESLAALAVLACLASPAQAFDFTVTYIDPAGQGFNSAADGAARRAALEFALSIWGQMLDGTVNIRVTARFMSVGGGTLAFAGPVTSHTGVPNGVAGTVYPVALASQLAGTDFNGGSAEVECTFNSNVDWYYGTDSATPGSQFDFVYVALHEIGHGLGFTDNMAESGAFIAFGQPNIYDRHLVRPGEGAMPDLTQTRRGQLITGGPLFFQGPASTPARPPNGPRIYTPNPYEPGSSIAHFDLTLTPDELMEPSVSNGFSNHDPGFAIEAFDDMGYQILSAPTAAESSWNLFE